ncbi:MAG: thioredoxin [Ruminococcaceae bacterium]|jgi:thioredoxin 1|nr:thioredoxin [Oscillospiraceae bacterium]
MAEITLTSDIFDAEVLDSNVPVLVDFWASWCGPCKMLAPIIEEIAKEYDGKIKVGKVNVDDEQKLAMDYGIASIPTVILFKDGEIKETLIGYRGKEEFETAINAVL